MKALQVLYNSLRERIDALPPNDRRALLVMFGVIGLAVVYLTLANSRSYQQTALEQFRNAMEDSRWIAVNEGQIKALTASPDASTAGAAGGDGSLINRATTSAKPFGIVFKRYQPEGDTGLRLWIEAAEFDQLMRWLAALDKQKIRLDQLDIDKRDEQPGLVDARVLLSL